VDPRVLLDIQPVTEQTPLRGQVLDNIPGLIHHAIMGKKGRHGSGLVLGLLILGVAGCVYEFPEPEDTSAALPEPTYTPTSDQAPPPATAKPHSDLRVLEQAMRNFGELDRLLGPWPKQVILADRGPLDGPLRGFGSTEKVPASGKYTVRAACVGASGATVAIGQEHPGTPFRPMELELKCSKTTSRDIALEQGDVFAHLVLPGPGDTEWTGAVGGVRVSRTG
jgi:hypothetical protein